MKAALRDASLWTNPDTRTPKKYHVADQTGHPVCRLATVLDAATIVDAATVHYSQRCGRDACSMAFATAGGGE